MVFTPLCIVLPWTVTPRAISTIQSSSVSCPNWLASESIEVRHFFAGFIQFQPVCNASLSCPKTEAPVRAARPHHWHWSWETCWRQLWQRLGEECGETRLLPSDANDPSVEIGMLEALRIYANQSARPLWPFRRRLNSVLNVKALVGAFSGIVTTNRWIVCSSTPPPAIATPSWPRYVISTSFSVYSFVPRPQLVSNIMQGAPKTSFN